MYAGVPIDVPICVSVAARRRRCATALIAFAMPKSVTVADAAGEQHVVRLDVAVHDAALVRVGERLRDVAQDADRLGRSAARRRASRARSDSPSTNGIV